MIIRSNCSRLLQVQFNSKKRPRATPYDDITNVSNAYAYPCRSPYVVLNEYLRVDTVTMEAILSRIICNPYINILLLSTSPIIDDNILACVPSEVKIGHFKFCGDPQRRSRAIRERVEAGSIGKKSRRTKTALKDDDTSTVHPHRIGVAGAKSNYR